jgi:hypothetical protein
LSSFSQFEDIDWLALADCAAATLIVPAATLTGLNEHKDTTSRGRLKRRAADGLITLKKYSAQTAPMYATNNVDVQFRPKEPTVDFWSISLMSTLKTIDFWLSAVEFALERGLSPQVVLLATGDFGLELKAKSQEVIAELPLPDV